MAGAVLLAALAAGCAGVPAANTPTPRTSPTVAQSPTASPTPQIVGTTRTVLSPLGLRIHSTPVLGSANVVGGFAQGASFTVLGYQSGGGGWFHVQGRTVTGWIVADPTLTAAGKFNQYAEANGVTALYPQDWGFQQDSLGALFVPQQGTGSIVLQTGPTLKSFGQAGLLGYAQTTSAPILVCGYTGTLTEYTKQTSYSGPTPAPLRVPRLPLYAEIRVTMNSSHAMLIGFNYQDVNQLDVFADLYNSIAFPFPLCEKVATATPTP